MGLAAPDHTVPYGTVLSRTLSQALRARLRSVCPLRDGLADGSQRHLARERASNFVTPFVGAKTSQNSLNLAPFGSGFHFLVVVVVLRSRFPIPRCGSSLKQVRRTAFEACNSATS